MVVRIQIAFKTIPTPENWEIESKEDLTAIELRNAVKQMIYTQVELNTGMKEPENKNILVI